jgi:hypothetical protein
MTEIDNKILNGASNRPLNIPFEKAFKKGNEETSGSCKRRVMK